jgi:tRNA(adenine34) deaminase
MPCSANDDLTSQVASGYMTRFEPEMRLALAEAGAQADTGTQAGIDERDVPVGAIVLGPDGAVIGRGRNRCLAETDPSAHAEIVAIRAAAAVLHSWRLDDCTLIVTLEPCAMCAGAVHSARIRRVVYGATDERAGAAGSLWDLLRDRRLGPPVEVIGGVLARECGQLLSEFFQRLR